MKLTFDVPDKYGEELQNTLQTVIREALKMLKDTDKAPDFGDEYYYINIVGEVDSDKWEGLNLEKDMLVFGNIYKTKEEAEFKCEQLKVIHELEELADDNQPWDSMAYDHYYLLYNSVNSQVEIGASYGANITPFYFNTFESAKAAVSKIGEERLKKYYFCIPEDKT